MQGHLNVVRILLDSRAQVDACALYGALKTENEAIEELLLDHGAHALSGSLDGRSALHLAAADGNLEICAYLADQDADVNYQDRAGATPLMLSAMEGKKGTTRFLLSREADVDITDREGNTALHYAGWFEKPKIFDILVSVGEADPEALNKAGEKPRSPNPGEKCAVM